MLLRASNYKPVIKLEPYKRKKKKTHKVKSHEKIEVHSFFPSLPISVCTLPSSPTSWDRFTGDMSYGSVAPAADSLLPHCRLPLGDEMTKTGIKIRCFLKVSSVIFHFPVNYHWYNIKVQLNISSSSQKFFKCLIFLTFFSYVHQAVMGECTPGHWPRCEKTAPPSVF